MKVLKRVTKAVRAHCIVLVLLGSLGQVSDGSVIFSQRPVDGGAAFISDFGLPQQRADNFELQLASAALVTKVRWWGSYVGGNVQADDFVVRFYEDAGGAPSINPSITITPLNVTRQAVGVRDNWNRTVFEYNGELPTAVPLGVSTTYYFSPINATSGGDWKWAGSSQGSNWGRSADGHIWEMYGGYDNYAFELIPEPATLSLLALGGLALLRKRRA